MSNYYY